MKHHKVLNWALIVIGALIVVLGVTLVLTVPSELKEGITARYELFLDGKFDDHRFDDDNDYLNGRGFRDRSWHHFSGPGFFFGKGLLVIGAVLLLIVLVKGIFFRRFWHHRHHFGHRKYGGEDEYKSPKEILREKYASGEISKEEYEERMGVLNEE